MSDFAPVEQGFHWYEYLDNFFNVEPFSIVKSINEIHKKKQKCKRISRANRKKLNIYKNKLKKFLHKWGSHKMHDFRYYVTNLLESVFIKFAEREKFEILAKDHDAHYRQRSFFIVYNMMKKYLRSITINEIYNGVIDKDIMKIISGISGYNLPGNYSLTEDTKSVDSTTNVNYWRNLRGKSSLSGSIRGSRRSRKIEEAMDEQTLEAVKVLSAAIEIHKNYIRSVCEKKIKRVKIKKPKLEKFKRVMKKKIFALAKGSKKRTPRTKKKMIYLEPPDTVTYSFMKTMQEIKAKSRALKKAEREACRDTLYIYSGKKEKRSQEKSLDEVSEKVIEEDNGKSEMRRALWEISRHRILMVRRTEKTEGERVFENIKKLENMKKKEFLIKCREGFEELFVLPEDKRISDEVSLDEWLIHKPSTRVYYERESTVAKVVEEQEEDLLELCKSSSNVSGDVTPTKDLLLEISVSGEESPVSDSESVYTSEHYLDEVSDCFREIEGGANVASSCEVAKSSEESEVEKYDRDPNKEACIDYKLDGLADQTPFFKKNKKEIKKVLRSYRKEDELSITSELMQELCETSGSETSDTTYYFQPPKEKLPEEKPEIFAQPINFRDFNHRKLQLYMMEKHCKASDVSSVSEYNVWNKAIFKIKQREKYYYKKIGVSESHERLKNDLKHLIKRITKARHRRPMLLSVRAKEDFLEDVNEKMFNQINFDEKKIFPIDKEDFTKNEKNNKEKKQQSSDQITSPCPSGSCLKTTDSSTMSDETSEDLIHQTENMMKKLNLREPYKKESEAFKEYENSVRKSYPCNRKFSEIQRHSNALEINRPISAPIDNRHYIHPTQKKGLLGINRYSTVEEIVSGMFPNAGDPPRMPYEIQEKYIRKPLTAPTILRKKRLENEFEIPYTPSAIEMDTLLDKLHPELQKDGIVPILSCGNNKSGSEASNDNELASERDSAPETTRLDDIEVESFLSRNEKSVEEDYYSVVKNRQAAPDKKIIVDAELEYRVKTSTIRYVTLKSEKMWPKHYFPDFIHFYKSLLERRIPVTFANIKLRTHIPFLKPDNELFELPHYAVLPYLHPPIAYELGEKIENRILWDRPDKFKLNYNQIGDKYFIKDFSQIAGFTNISDTHIAPDDGNRNEEQPEEFFLQAKDINWLLWNSPEYNYILSNKLLNRLLSDLGSTPDIYEKFNILLKNKKLGYVPMKELMYSNQEKLFNYVSSQFLHKLAVKYPKRFLRLLFFVYNQYGVQKHICTFIKPVRLSLPKLADWKGCARFISNRFHCTELNSDVYPPLQLNGPDKTLYNQTGNLYELGILLECLLLGGGYDAYIVSGMVTQVRSCGTMETQPPEEKDMKAPDIGFKRKQSEQPITIETFFQSFDRDKFADRLARLNSENPKLLEELYIDQMAKRGGWKDDIQEKHLPYIGKMATPQGIDLIEKLKQEIKERQMRRKSTKELEKLLKKLQEERIKYLQEKQTDAVFQEDVGALEEECKKYLYPPDVEIKSMYVEEMKLRRLKERSQEKLLQKRADEDKKKKKNEEKYFKNLYSKYETKVYLPPLLKTHKEYEEEKLKFLDEIRQQIGDQEGVFDKIYQEERMSFEHQEDAFIRNEIYELYFGEKTKRDRKRKLKKSEKVGSKETIIEAEEEKKLVETKHVKETAGEIEEERKTVTDTENTPVERKTVEREEDEEIDDVDEEMSEEEEIGEFEAVLEPEPPQKMKINKKAVRKLRAKMEKRFLFVRRQLQEIPTKEPEPIEKTKAIDPVIYCWILIKKNDKDVSEDTFLDIKTGLLYPTIDKQYLRIDCVWNDKNYYIPVYQRKHVKMTRMFNFKDDKYWWHLLCGEPRKNQLLRRSMRDTVDPMIQKHLEVPRTWVGHMKFPKKRFDKIFKDEKMKSFRYKRVRIDVYEYGAEKNGIRKRVSEFYNMEQTRLQCIREEFEHRNDFLVYRTKFYKNEKHTDPETDAVKTAEVFEPGRTDQLKCCRCYQFPDGRKTIDMYFYSEFRQDFLKMFSVSNKRLKMQFVKGRTDQMVKLKMSYFENRFFDKEHHKESLFNRIVVSFHQKAPYQTQLKLSGYFEDPPIRLEIDLKVGLSYYFFRDEGEKELKFAIWELHYNIVEGMFITPDIQPNRLYFFGSSEERKSTLEREVMMEREQADKIKFLAVARSAEREINDIIKQKRDDEKNISIDVSRKSKWSPEVIEKLKIEQLYLIAQRVENRLNILREKNIVNYFEDLGEGRKLDFVIMQILKSIAGDEFNLKLAQCINQLFRKYQKAQKKGCPSAKTFALVADKFCNFIDAYRDYYNKHSQEAEEYYRRYNTNEEDESDNIIRKHIYGENFSDNISNLKNVLTLFSPQSMELWFDKWFKKQIKQYGTQDVGEMMQSVDEILLLKEPKGTKPINTSFWKALGEFKNTLETKEEAAPTSDKSSISFSTDSIAKNNLKEKTEIGTSDTDTDDLCETVLARYVDKKNEPSENETILQGYNKKEDKLSFSKDSYKISKEDINLEDVFTNKIKKLVKRYGIMNIKEGLANLGMEKYNLQKDVGNIDCAYFMEDSQRKALEQYRIELLKKINATKEMEEEFEKKHESESSGSNKRFHDSVDKALSGYPWGLKATELDEDLTIMAETLEGQLMKHRFKKYTAPKRIFTELEESESSTEQILPGWVKTKKSNKELEKIMPLAKKSMEGNMDLKQQKLLKNILFNLIFKEQTKASPAELEKVFKKFMEGKDAWGPNWNNYGDRLKQLLTETYQQQVIEHNFDEYKFQENFLGLSKDDSTPYEEIKKLDIVEIPFSECELSSEDHSQDLKQVFEDPLKDFWMIKSEKGCLPSLESLMDRKKKLKEYQKKIMNTLSTDEKNNRKTKICQTGLESEMFPEIKDSDISKSWFEEVYWEKRDK